MEVHLTPDQEALIAQAVERGRYASTEAAVKEALAIWEENERDRAELIASLEEADVDFEAGRGTEYTEETLPALFAELKEEARASRPVTRT